MSWKDTCLDWQRHLDNCVFSEELVRRRLFHALQNCSYPHIQMRIFVLGKTTVNICSFFFFFSLYSNFTITIKGGDLYFALCISRIQKMQMTENLDSKQRNRQYSFFGFSAKRVALNDSVSFNSVSFIQLFNFVRAVCGLGKNCCSQISCSAFTLKMAIS